MKKKKLSSNMEDYMEAIAVLKKKKGVARVKDLANLLGVKKSSVTSALNTLAQNGFVIHERYGYIELTKEGNELAQYIQKKHNVLTRFLTNILNIEPDIAGKDACKMEHTLSPQSFQKLTKFIEFVETCPEGNSPDWLESFNYYLKTGKRRKCKIREMKQRPKSR